MSRAGLVISALVLATAVAGSGCEGKKQAAPAGGTAALAPAKLPVAVFVDEQQVAGELELGGEPRPLTELVPAPPLPAWLALEAIDAAGKVHTTMAPARNQPGKVPVLARTADGVALGFRTAGATGPLADAVPRVTRVT